MVSQGTGKVHAGFGLNLPDRGPPSPFLEVSGFTSVLDLGPPEYFQAGGRVSWDCRGGAGAVGVRHKLSLSPWPSWGQEVLVGRSFGGGDKP